MIPDRTPAPIATLDRHQPDCACPPCAHARFWRAANFIAWRALGGFALAAALITLDDCVRSTGGLLLMIGAAS